MILEMSEKAVYDVSGFHARIQEVAIVVAKVCPSDIVVVYNVQQRFTEEILVLQLLSQCQNLDRRLLDFL